MVIQRVIDACYHLEAQLKVVTGSGLKKKLKEIRYKDLILKKEEEYINDTI